MQIRVFPALFSVSYELSMLRNTISLLLYYISVIQLLENTSTSAGGKDKTQTETEIVYWLSTQLIMQKFIFRYFSSLFFALFSLSSFTYKRKYYFKILSEEFRGQKKRAKETQSETSERDLLSCKIIINDVKINCVFFAHILYLFSRPTQLADWELNFCLMKRRRREGWGSGGVATVAVYSCSWL